jgi:radial spoke head protein 4A
METSQEDLFNLLSTIKSKDGNKNIYDHLMKLFETQMELNDDKKFLDLFEDISLKIKSSEGKYFDEEAEKSFNSLLTYLEEFNVHAKSKKTLIEPLVKKEGDEITPVTQVGYVPEYHNLFQIFEWFGLSMGEKMAYLLTNSLRNLASAKNLGNVIFWGKIYGSEKDYYIAEAIGGEGGGKNLNNILF